jgi:glycine cleavage system H protein
VVARNEDLSQKPELLNSDPYGAGWMMRIELDAKAPAAGLLRPSEYEQFLKESE